LRGNVFLEKENIKSKKGEAVRFSKKQRVIVQETIVNKVKIIGIRIVSIAVCSNHVHFVAEYVDVPIGVVVGTYKNAGRVALRKQGFEGRVWTRGFDKRYCFDEKELRTKSEYVLKHE